MSEHRRGFILQQNTLPTLEFWSQRRLDHKPHQLLVELQATHPRAPFASIIKNAEPHKRASESILQTAKHQDAQIRNSAHLNLPDSK